MTLFKNITRFTVASALCLSAWSCNLEIIESAEKGFLGVEIQRDDQVSVKALQDPSEDMVFSLRILKGEELVKTVADYRSLSSEPVELAAGQYTVEAICGDENQKAAFDAPLYKGSTTVKISPDKVNTANITAKLENTLVSVELDESVSQFFSTTSVIVANSSASLTYSNTLNNYDKVAYFEPDGALTWRVDFTTAEGAVYSNSDFYTDVKVREHYKLHFSIQESSDQNGKLAFRLIVDDSMNQHEYDLVLDFDMTELPQTQTNGFDITQKTYFTLGNDQPKIINFSAPKGIKSLVITSSDDVMTKAYVWYDLVEADSNTIASLAAKGIKAARIEYGATSASIDITDFIKELPLGDYSMDFMLYDIKNHMSRTDFDFTIMSDVDADMVAVNPWGRFVIATGKWFEEERPEGTTFAYKKNSDQQWEELDESKLMIDNQAKTFTAIIDGLDAQTLYQIKAVSAKDKDTRTVDVTTQTASNLYNLNFDDWYQSGKVWYPYAQDSNPTVWDSANPVVASFGGSITTPLDQGTVRGRAASLMSKKVVIAFAAGNLYTGKFGKQSGMGAILDWGTPFNSRPVALKGYYKYTPANINYADDGHSSLKGSTDRCQIQVILTDWEKPFTINTSNGVFVDLQNDPAIIAYAKFESDETVTNFKEITLPLVYRNNRTPKYIVVVFASSYLGDYFTGGEGSTLIVDEFSLEYSPSNITSEQMAQTNILSLQ